MTERLFLRHRAGRPMWAGAGLVLSCLLLSLVLIVTGCGGGSSGTSTTASTATGVTTATTGATTEVSATDLADAISSAWAKAIKSLNDLLKNQPEPSAVQSQIESLKNASIQTLVAFGKKRETFDASTRTQVDSAVSSALAAMGSEDFYTTYMDNWDYYSYMSGDVDFTNLLASFNTLQVYANFEELKAKYPDEATRWGIQ